MAFEFAEDGFFVVEEIADQTVGMAVVEGEGVFRAGAEDTGGEGVREVGDVVVCGGGEVDETGEVGGYGVEGGDVVESELA